ncbi:site-specific DNA-methyltransferase [Burkholderia cepacia]|uniref:site-specific DNA-methyltransferase n=1 Tax=Burkholderia cepacia TaxID=292 RepID=UPI001865D83F|nr:site-specific DNA-methyltransferase [Burkholderia cepacia]MBE2967663.1 site-specific DNA-methyltransferase [Burkholderia cepacia]
MNDTSAQYQHKQEAVQRPDVGVQDQFSIKKPNRVYRYDSSLDPALSWDETRERELGEWLIGLVARCAEKGEAAVFQSPQIWTGGGVQVQSLQAVAGLLQSLSQPFLNWAGKAERHQLSVPTTPLFVHERHSTKAILDGIKSRKAKGTNLDLFGDPQLDVTDRLDAYEHRGPWQNRMILGDSLQVMNSMLEFEGLGGQVQMVFIDPPYGVKFGSNFQPFVRKRDVKHGADAEMTREPEMVKAYRDTWELGLHSYLTYLRDRLMLAKELLSESGSIFVQISDENLHHVKEVLDEVMGANNFVSVISFKKTTSASGDLLASVNDFLVWYSKDKERIKYRQIYVPKAMEPDNVYKYIQLPDGTSRTLTPSEYDNPGSLPEGARIYSLDNITSPRPAGEGDLREFTFNGTRFPLTKGTFKTDERGLKQLEKAGRLGVSGATLRYKRFLSDFPVKAVTNVWDDTSTGSFTESKVYVVQTATKVIQRCMLMCTDPGDLVFDPTCGSGTTAYVAEQWGRRWITCDTSRVPLALARQRLLTATFPYYDLKDPKLGPAGGFVYERKQNRKGEEVGGLVPHITLGSIANNEQPSTEVVVDRPEERKGVVRVAGPFVVEATIAPAQTMDASDSTAEAQSGGLAVGEPLAVYGDVATHIERMTQVLRQSKTLRLPGNRELALEQVRRTSDGDILHAEAADADGKRIAIVFGPESGAISADMVFEAAREAHFLRYDQLYFFAFAIQAKARELIEERNKDGAPKLRIHCTYVAVTPDVAMSDLLKTTRASEIFSVTGLPDVKLTKLPQKNNAGEALYQVDVKGLDVFNPANMEQESVEGENLPCWMLDTDYDPSGSFYATQVFFPKTSAWDNLQKSLKADFDDSMWSHLAGTTSEPFVSGERRRVAVKVIDERGNELMRILEVA